MLDKTGTLTHTGGPGMSFSGGELSARERLLIASLARNSHHPLSPGRSPNRSRVMPAFRSTCSLRYPVRDIEGTVDGHGSGWDRIRSSCRHTAVADDASADEPESTCLCRDRRHGARVLSGCNPYRSGVERLLDGSGIGFPCRSILSGDGDRERSHLEDASPAGTVPLHFNQSPADKLAFVSGCRGGGSAC